MAQDVILPHRVIDHQTGNVVDFEALVSRCAQAEVVAIGEDHLDPSTHLFELAVLQGLFRYKTDLVLSLEMFERDVQPSLDQYLSGEITEQDLLAQSRPWGNYETDYRPMVEFAKTNGFGVVAANVPRPIAAAVAQAGYAMTDFTDEERQYISPDFEAPEDGYWDAFMATMQMAGMSGMSVSEETMHLYYEAQVLKDEAMADSIRIAANTHPDATIFHVTGAFHIIDNLGTYSRVQRNLPGADTVSITVVPVENLLDPVPEDAPIADYIVLVLAAGIEEMLEMPPMPSALSEEGGNSGE